MEWHQGRMILVPHQPLLLILVGFGYSSTFSIRECCWIIPAVFLELFHLGTMGGYHVELEPQSDEWWSVAVTMSRKSVIKLLQIVIQQPAIKNRCGWTHIHTCFLFLLGGHLLLKRPMTLDFTNVCSNGYLSLCQPLLAVLNQSTLACLRTHRSNSGLRQQKRWSGTFAVGIQSDGMLLLSPCKCLAELDPILCKNSLMNRTSRCFLWLRAGA